MQRGILSIVLYNPIRWNWPTLPRPSTRWRVELENRIEAVISQRNEYEAVLASMSEGVIAVDMEERILNMNQAGSPDVGHQAP